MEAGKDAEAITAFQETVKIDPGFTEAWQHLAILYAKVGQEKKSLDAYHRAKKWRSTSRNPRPRIGCLTRI